MSQIQVKEHYSVCSIKLHANDHCCFADVFHISTLSDNTARLTTACVCGGAIQALYHYIWTEQCSVGSKHMLDK